MLAKMLQKAGDSEYAVRAGAFDQFYGVQHIRYHAVLTFSAGSGVPINA